MIAPWEKYIEEAKKNNMKIGDFRTVKGQYLTDNYGDPCAFECRECGAAMTIVDDPKIEQPNFCFKCGAKFDWEGVWEAFLNEHFPEESKP